TDIATSWGLATFSTNGASLESIDFTRDIDGVTKTIRTVFPCSETDRKGRCLLVAFDQKTPFYYKLASVIDEQDDYKVMYEYDSEDVSVRKTFVVDKSCPKINLILDVTPKSEKRIEPRIFFTSPLMPDLQENNITSAI